MRAKCKREVVLEIFCNRERTDKWRACETALAHLTLQTLSSLHFMSAALLKSFPEIFTSA